MKKILLAMTVVALLTGCRGEDEDALIFETVSADKTVKLSNEDNSPSCSVHLEIAAATGPNEHKAEIVNNAIQQRFLEVQDLPMQEAADSFANTYTSNYQKNFLPLFNHDRGDEKKFAWYDYHYIIKTEAASGHKGVTVYHVYLDYYEGGAHGINQHLVMNFEPVTGRTLSLDDIFAPGYEHLLNTILLKALREKTGAKNLEALHEQGYLYSMDMFPSENFTLDEETITFIYNPYEIAPYDKGSIELTIAYSALESILKNSFEI